MSRRLISFSVMIADQPGACVGRRLEPLCFLQKTIGPSAKPLQFLRDLTQSPFIFGSSVWRHDLARKNSGQMQDACRLQPVVRFA